MDAVGLLKTFQNAAFNPNLEIYIVIALILEMLVIATPIKL